MDQVPPIQPSQQRELPQPFYTRTSVLVAVCIVIGFILLTPFFFFLRSTRKPIPLNKVIPSEGITHSPSSSQQTQKTNKTYQNQWYKLSYPKDWIDTTKTYNAPAGTLLVLQPTTPSGKNPKIAVEIMDPQTTSLATLSKNFTLLGFTKSSAAVGDNPAEKFQGSLAVETKTIRNTVYLFEAKNKVYLLKLSYTSETIDSQVEDEFADFVKNFSL